MEWGGEGEARGSGIGEGMILVKREISWYFYCMKLASGKEADNGCWRN